MFYAGHTVLDLALLPTPSDDAIFVAAVGADGEKVTACHGSVHRLVISNAAVAYGVQGQLSLWEVSTSTTGTFESVLHGSSSWKETVSCVKGRESLLCLAHGKQLDVAKYTITLTDRLGIDLVCEWDWGARV